MRLEQLIQLIEIDSCKSVSKAAKNLYMTQPALSVSLNSFEEELGIKLFRRTNMGVMATTEGKEVIALARNILDDIEKIRQVGHTGEISGEVKVGIPGAILNAFSTELLIAFQQQYPKATLILQETSPEEVIMNIGKDYTIGIGVVVNSKRYKLDNINKSSLYQWEPLDFPQISDHSKIKLFVGADHPLAKKKEVTLEEIKSYQVIQFKNMTNFLENEQCQQDYQITTVHDREVLKKLLVSGMGVSLLPEIFGYNDIYIKDGLITTVEISDIEEGGTLYLAYPKNNYSNMLEEKTVELLKLQFSNIRI